MTLRVKVTPGDVRALLNSLGRITVSAKVTAGELTDTEIQAIAGLFEKWGVGQVVNPKDLRQYNGVLYECIQGHTTQADWTPDTTASLWKTVAAPGVTPAWVQPTGAHDAYAIGDLVTYAGKTWRSTIAANTTVPGENPAFGWWVEN